MAALNGLSGVAATVMQPRADMASEWDDCRHSFHIRLVIISNDRIGLYLRMVHGSPKKGFCTRPIPCVPQQDINDLPVLIDCAIQVKFLLAAKAKHFIHRPVSPDSPAILGAS
jgi:hypothetical protein